jgi:hypothetical protein
VDTINWITMKGNLWETRARQGQIGKAGEWYGVQSSVFCLDVDDGNGMYVITENVCITNNTAGLKVGHIVDRMNFTNNVVVSTDDPRINGGYHTAALSTVPFQIGPQNSHNTMVYQRNIHVHLPLPRPLVAVPAAQVIPWKASNYCPNSPSFVAENPPPTFVDRNLYFSDDIAGVVVCPTWNGTTLIPRGNGRRLEAWTSTPFLTWIRFSIRLPSRRTNAVSE